jgi:hypothetical protein
MDLGSSGNHFYAVKANASNDVYALGQSAGGGLARALDARAFRVLSRLPPVASHHAQHHAVASPNWLLLNGASWPLAAVTLTRLRTATIEGTGDQMWSQAVVDSRAEARGRQCDRDRSATQQLRPALVCCVRLISRA